MKGIRFRKLLEPVTLAGMTIRNRIVMPPMGTAMQAQGTYGLDLHKDFYEARAKGGAGLVIVETTGVDYRQGRITNTELTLHEDARIPGMRELAAAIKRHGAKAAIQLTHGGHSTKASILGVQPVGPSAVARPGYDLSRELTAEEVGDIVVHFANAARRAREAGFDAIEIGACHRGLIAQFLSRAWNKRQDDFGGSLANRARLLLQVIKATRELVGTDFPILCRLNASEYWGTLEGGVTLQEAQETARLAEEAGADCIHVTSFPGLWPFHATDTLASGMPSSMAPGLNVGFAQAVKSCINVPVIAVGRISPELGERVLRKKQADLIAMGRQLIADPELPNKIMSGRLEDVVPCVYCNRCLGPALPRDCTINAANGRERELPISPAAKIKKVLIVGGGPAGMEAARVAALRGHRVMLVEKEHSLGGLLNTAAIFREEYASLARYLSTQVRKLGVQITLGKEASAGFVATLAPDAVIVATGSVPLVPNIPGIEGDNVITLDAAEHVNEARTNRSALAVRAWLRKIVLRAGLAMLKDPKRAWIVNLLSRIILPMGKEVIVMGGGLPGVELASFLAERGKKVTVVTNSATIVEVSTPMNLLAQHLCRNLAASGVALLADAKVERIAGAGVVVTTHDGKTSTIKADTVALAGARRADAGLAQALQGAVAEIHTVGDCVEPRGILEAMHAGYRIGRVV